MEGDCNNLEASEASSSRERGPEKKPDETFSQQEQSLCDGVKNMWEVEHRDGPQEQQGEFGH
jgi:hypothetical protein